MATNKDQDHLKMLVDRLFEVEVIFNDAKTERNDLVKDMKAEIKSRYDETGVEAKEVLRLVKIKLEEQAARETLAELEGDLGTFEILYGKKTATDDDDDAEI